MTCWNSAEILWLLSQVPLYHLTTMRSKFEFFLECHLEQVLKTRTFVTDTSFEWMFFPGQNSCSTPELYTPRQRQDLMILLLTYFLKTYLCVLFESQELACSIWRFLQLRLGCGWKVRKEICHLLKHRLDQGDSTWSLVVLNQFYWWSCLSIPYRAHWVSFS